jgi:pilus assembly protein CpaE
MRELVRLILDSSDNGTGASGAGKSLLGKLDLKSMMNKVGKKAEAAA